MATESNILRQILENKGKISIQLIGKQLKISHDYVRYLCQELLKRGLVKKLKKKDWYKITSKGEKETGKREKPHRRPPSKKRISHKKTIGRKIQKKVGKKFKNKMTKRKKKPKKKEMKRKLRKKTKKPMKRKATKRARKTIKRSKRIEEKVMLLGRE